ncbi:MAG TPA: hypothetical protein VJ765_01160 [Chitinophagaceae bacterium]|nr:hypothetical protein [Chitinophagaceae bacterium]
MKTKLAFISILAFAILLTSCQKEISGEINNNNGNNSAFPYYFIATINGKTVKFEADDISSRYGCGTSQPFSAIAPSDYDIYEGTVLLDPLEPTKNSAWVHILKYFNHDPNQAERYSMINPGDYPYGYSDVSSSTINGASIDYIDENGVTWFSETGPQSTTSNFTIVELIDNTDGTSGKIFKATFNCKLYNFDGSSSVQVTNGVIRGKILTP